MGFEEIVWKLYEVLSWITKFIYLNILWIIFSLLGIVFLGFFPATATMFGITRKWLLGEKDIPIFKTFLKLYKTNFIESNIIGSLLLIFGAILYIDLRFFQTTDSILLSFFNFFIIFAFFIYFVVVLYIFPVYVHYKLKIFEYIKHSIIIVIGKPLHSIMMIVGSYLVYMITSMLPVLSIFLGGSLLSFILMWVAMMSFPKNEIEVGEAEWN